VGGAEVVLSCLDQALVAAGHTSLVVACRGSQTAGTLIPSAALPPTLTPEARSLLHEAHRVAIARALAQWRVDVMHLHGVDAMSYLPHGPVPTLLTLHLAPGCYPAEVFAEPREHFYLNCVSTSQCRACPRAGNLLGVVENGVPLDPGEVVGPPGAYVMAVGRLCPEKGFHLAIEATRRARVPLVLAGSVFAYPEHVDYFLTEIIPRLDEQCQFIGPVVGKRKARLLAGARCLLVTSLVPETSSLVAMESLACGTPVVAFPAGALPEIIAHGRTGLIVKNVCEMAQAIGQVGSLNRSDCRQTAQERFDAARMCREYVALYQRLAGVTATATRPRGTRGHVDVERITSRTELDALRDEWDDLWAQCPAATPFQSSAWLVPWYRRLSRGSACALALRHSGELVGLAPLLIDSLETGERRLSMAGAGISDYLDVLLAPRAEQSALAALWEYLRDGTHEFDVCDLEHLSPDGPLAGGLAERCDPALRRPDEPCPVLGLTPGASLRDCLPAEKWKRLAYDRRRVSREGPAAFEQATEANFDELIAGLFDLHQARWRERHQGGVLQDPAIQQFHVEAGKRLLRLGVLRLYGLRLRGRLIAAYYGFLAHRRGYYYLGGFDPQWQRLSPGVLLVGHAVEAALAEGANSFDFLRGQEPYKYTWGARDRRTFRWRFDCQQILSAPRLKTRPSPEDR
jgi:CelD/BcsL family acetyltransferase involved in cellulose biosynthesis/glycosyltransferase involved in cell wall biosynthesis